MVGSEGKGARPGMLRGGRDARGGTEGGRGGKKKQHFSRVMSHGAGSENKRDYLLILLVTTLN